VDHAVEHVGQRVARVQEKASHASLPLCVPARFVAVSSPVAQDESASRFSWPR
jgi:hypothetical protein